MRPGMSDWAVLTDAVACLYAAGRDIDWDGFHRGGGQDRVGLPGYPFERTRHWLPPAPQAVAAEPAQSGAEQHTGADLPIATPALVAAGPGQEPVRAVLSRVIGTLLGHRSPADPDVPFLELGADSMTLFQLLQAVQKTFGITIPISSLFEELDTLNRLAEHIGGLAQPQVAAVVTAQVLRHHREHRHRFRNGADGGRHGDVPATVGQFLQVHAQVMSQAYELLRVNRPMAAGPPGPRRGARPGELPGGRVAPGATEDVHRVPPGRPAAAGGLTGTQGAFARQLVERYAARTRRSGGTRRRRTTAALRPAARPPGVPGSPADPVPRDRGSVTRGPDLGHRRQRLHRPDHGLRGQSLRPPGAVHRLGHRRPARRGMQLGPHSPLAAEVARLICDMT